MITPPNGFDGVSDIIIENDKIELLSGKDLLKISITEKSTLLYDLSA